MLERPPALRLRMSALLRHGLFPLVWECKEQSSNGLRILLSDCLALDVEIHALSLSLMLAGIFDREFKHRLVQKTFPVSDGSDHLSSNCVANNR